MAITVQASDGTDLPICSLAQTFGYTDDLLTTATVTYHQKNTLIPIDYVQTFTYDGEGNLTDATQWEPVITESKVNK